MKRISLCLGLIAPIGLLWACTGDDDTFRPTDAGTFEASTSDQNTRPPEKDAAAPLACGDSTGAPPRVLLIQGTVKGSELVAVNMTTKAVDGRLAFDGGYGSTSALGTDPYLLDAENDIVTRLDAREPWKPVASWNVRGDDVVSGGDPNAQPVAVVQPSCTKAYVLRFNRNRIAIIDPSQRAGGTPTAYIDLSSLQQPGDTKSIEMTSAVYVASKKRVYVLLGNIDLTKFGKVGGFTKLVCANLKPAIIAIDVETDNVVSLGGSGPGGGIVLEGYNPPVGTPLVYDAAFDRLLVLHGGCNADVGDGGPGAMTRQRVEQVDLATGAVKTLLTLDQDGKFPSTLALASSDHAAIAFYFDAYHWNPAQPALGPAIQGGMDLIVNDGRGAFVGSRQTYLEDGGTGPLEVVSVPLPDAGPSVITTDPFSKPGGYVAGIEAWPHQ
jgi:hypothetical protein